MIAQSNQAIHSTSRWHVSWILLSLTCLLGCSQAGNEYVAPPPHEVTFAFPISAPISPFVDETGILEATNDAEVRSRVRGFLKTVDFEPGQPVKKGDVLYTIEADQYEAAEEKAKAAVATAVAAIGIAQADLKVAEAAVLKASQDLDREERLKLQNASSEAQYDTAVANAAATKASLEAARANVAAAQSAKLEADAALRQAELDLGYTSVHAEIDGRITKTNFKVGNLVENGSPLTSIVDSTEVFANFSLSDRAVLRIMRSRKAANLDQEDAKTQFWRALPVYLAREGDEGFPFQGRLNDVDQAGVDSRTGTLGLRGIFDNASNQLLPGLFVSLRVPITDPVDTLIIPERAILRSEQGNQVLTVDDDNVVSQKEIELGQSVGGWALVLSGLEPTTRVIIDGLQFSRPGGKVIPKQATFEVDPTKLLRGLDTPQHATASANSSAAPSTVPSDTSNESNQHTVE